MPDAHYHRDGAMRFDGNFGSAPNYEPNSMGGPKEDKKYAERPEPVGEVAARYNHRDGNNDYAQPGDLFRLIGKDAQQRLINNIVGSLKETQERIQRLQVSHFTKADPAYGAGVAAGLGLKVEEGELVAGDD